MAETDMADAVLGHSKRLLSAVKERARRNFTHPLGTTVLSPRDALSRIQAMPGEELSALIAKTGRDEFMSQFEALLEKVSSHTP